MCWFTLPGHPVSPCDPRRPPPPRLGPSGGACAPPGPPEESPRRLPPARLPQHPPRRRSWAASLSLSTHYSEDSRAPEAPIPRGPAPSPQADNQSLHGLRRGWVPMRGSARCPPPSGAVPGVGPRTGRTGAPAGPRLPGSFPSRPNPPHGHPAAPMASNAVRRKRTTRRSQRKPNQHSLCDFSSAQSRYGQSPSFALTPQNSVLAHCRSLLRFGLGLATPVTHVPRKCNRKTAGWQGMAV